MAIPTYESGASLNPLPNARVQNSADANAFGAGVAKAGQGLLDAATAKAQEYEYAEALEASNEFLREVDDLHLNVQTGLYNTRKRGAAMNMAQDADKAMADLAAKYQKKMRGPFMTNAFNEHAQRVMIAQGRANRKWEVAEVDTYQNEEAEARKNNAYERISRYFDDDEMVELERQNILDAVEYQKRGAGPEARAAALAEVESNVAVLRIWRMMESDPARARAFFDENKDVFLGEMRGNVERTLQVYENQVIVADLMGQFGGDESGALDYIREHYSGARQSRLVTDYRQRMNEAYALEARQAAQLAKVQTENYQALVMDFLNNGAAIPVDEMNKMFASRQIGFEEYMKLQSANADLADVSKVQAAILADPTYHNASPDEIYAAVRGRMNISATESMAYVSNLQTAVMSGNATQADITLAKNRAWISESDAERLSDLEKNYLPEQKKYLDEQRKDFEKEIKDLEKNGLSTEGVLAATDFFMREAAKLDPADPGYREKVFKTKQQALLHSFDAHSGGLRSNLRELQSGYEMTRFNILDNGYTESVLHMQPSAASTFPNELAVNYFVQGGGRVSSPFGATEAFRDSGHKGLDIAAPAGAPVAAPHMDGFTVTKVITGKKQSKTKNDAGNMVTMEKTIGGRRIEVSYLHLGEVGVKSGDLLVSGQVVGGVGNTGYTVGATGNHLDVRVKVDGEYVDPVTLPYLLADMEDPGPRYSSEFTKGMKKGAE